MNDGHNYKVLNNKIIKLCKKKTHMSDSKYYKG